MIHPIATGRVFWRTLRAPWWDRARLRREQDRLLQRLVQHACATVPYYRKRFAEAGVDPASIRTVDDLPRVPITTRADLQAVDPEAIVSSAFDPQRLKSEFTTGSSGRPLTLRYERSWAVRHQAMFLRVLMTAGYRPPRPALLLTSGPRGGAGRWLGWHYASYHQSPAELLEQVNRLRPRLIYGWVTPLRRLAQHIQEQGASVHRAQVLVSTAEAVDGPTRALFERVLADRAVAMYGLTEMGAIGLPCPDGHGYHLAEDAVVVEFLEAVGGGPARRMVMTNLHLRAMPFIRYVVGDLGVPGPTDRCTCGRTLARLDRVEGREVDCVRLRDGRIMLPYEFTLFLEQIPGIRRYQVIQEAIDRFIVGYEPAEATNAHGWGTEQAIQRAMASLVGEQALVRVQRHDSLDPPPGRKFRVVESRLTAASISK